MAYLIIHVEPMENDTLPEPEKKPIIAQFHKRSKGGSVDIEEAEELLNKHGFDLGPVVGAYVVLDYPLTAYVYKSDNKEGFGRSGSMLHRWPVRKVE